MLCAMSDVHGAPDDAAFTDSYTQNPGLLQLPSHLIAPHVCASLTPRDVLCGLALTSKRMHDIVSDFEADLATQWLQKGILSGRLELVRRCACDVHQPSTPYPRMSM